MEQESTKMLTPQEVIDRLAALVSMEIKGRDLIAQYNSDQNLKAQFRKDPTWQCFGELERENGLHQLSVVVPYNTHDRTLSMEAFQKKCLSPVAIELGLKLVRSKDFEIVMFDLELPKGCHESVRGRSGAVSIRLVTDYNIEYDAFFTRYDLLCRWNEIKGI